MAPGGATAVPRSGVKDGEMNQGTGKSQLLWLQMEGRGGGEKEKKKIKPAKASEEHCPANSHLDPKQGGKEQVGAVLVMGAGWGTEL